MGRLGRRFDEASFHRWLRRTLAAGRQGPLPLGDDAAALGVPKGSVLLATSDALAEGYHFLAQTPPRRIGAACVAVNLSDISAKGGTPLGLLIDLVLPVGTPFRWATEVIRGAEAEARRYRVGVVGGDAKPGHARVVVGTALGAAPAKRLPGRHRARPGDLVVTTGRVGRGGWIAGSASGRPSPSAVIRLLKVTPRLRAGTLLARHANAMIDTSDGLADAVRLVAEASKVRIVLDQGRLPYWNTRLRRLPEANRWSRAFYGGDYELVATLPAGAWTAARRSMGQHKLSISVIGRVEPGRGAFLRLHDRTIPLPSGSWRPFNETRGIRTGRRSQT